MMDIVEEEEYSDLHKKFLRCVTAKGSLSLPTAQSYLDRLKEDSPDDSSLEMDELIQKINLALRKFNQQVSIVKHEQLNEDFVVFSTIAPIPEMIAVQKMMRPVDFKYFEAVLRSLLNHDDFQLSYKSALATEVKGAAASKRRSGENEKFLQMWIKLGYFTNVDGILYLGPKSIVELNGFISAEYPDLINTCELCLNVTFVNIFCRHCTKFFHQACLDKFWQSVPNACPKCRNVAGWKED